MKKVFSVTVIILLLTTSVYAEGGYISVKSAHDDKTTADRLETVLKQKGMNVFIRINHAQGAENGPAQGTTHGCPTQRGSGMEYRVFPKLREEVAGRVHADQKRTGGEDSSQRLRIGGVNWRG